MGLERELAMKRAAWVLGTILTWAAPGPAGAAPFTPQAIDETSKICAQEAHRQELAQGLPRHILAAIAKAETGRWDETRRASFAWPWTVTAEGEGRYFATKAEALAEVRRLQARRITNIDVGCMQVNLGWHGHQFASLEEAMDPAANTAFAGRFLATLRATSTDWMEAAGRYHSSLAERNESYRAKVTRLWDETKRDEAKRPEFYAALAKDGASSGHAPTPGSFAATLNARHPTAPAIKTSRPSVVPIDYERTAAINANFRAARTRTAETGGGPIDNAATAAANRARATAPRIGPAIERDGRANAAPDRFAAKRMSDLARWRAGESPRAHRDAPLPGRATRATEETY